MTDASIEEFNFNPWVLWIIGGFSGFISGFFGIGGGVFIVPALCMFLKYPIKRAIATSLGAIIVYATGGTILHTFQSHSQIWQIVLFASIGAIPAARLGVKLRTKLPEQALHLMFALVLFLASFRIIFKDMFESWQIIPSDQYYWYLIVGIVGGLFSACLGIGGGVIMIPAMFIFGGIPMEQASPTSLATVIIISASGIIFQKKLKTFHMPSMLHLAISGLIAAGLGAILLYWLSVNSPQMLQKLFGYLLILIALRMILQLRVLRRKSSPADDI